MPEPGETAAMAHGLDCAWTLRALPPSTATSAHATENLFMKTISINLQAASQKLRDTRVHRQLVRQLRNLVPFVWQSNELHCATQLAQSRHHLLRLANRHARVV